MYYCYKMYIIYLIKWTFNGLQSQNWRHLIKYSNRSLWYSTKKLIKTKNILYISTALIRSGHSWRSMFYKQFLSIFTIHLIYPFKTPRRHQNTLQPLETSMTTASLSHQRCPLLALIACCDGCIKPHKVWNQAAFGVPNKSTAAAHVIPHPRVVARGSAEGPKGPKGSKGRQFFGGFFWLIGNERLLFDISHWHQLFEGGRCTTFCWFFFGCCCSCDVWGFAE